MSQNFLTGSDVRLQARSGRLQGPTPGLAPGYVQANLVVVPQNLAFDFLLFCTRNSQPCPVLDVTEPPSAEPRLIAPGADVRIDLPKYCVYKAGELVDEPDYLTNWWRDDMVAFLLGCSFTFENALVRAGIPVRHLEHGSNVPMYKTAIACQAAGMFHGPLVVSMRPMTPSQAIAATQICSRYPKAHGKPIHWGDPAGLGIRDLDHPDYGDPVEIRQEEVPVFWACGVTPQAVAIESKPPLLLTHKPGHMFVSDWQDYQLEE